MEVKKLLSIVELFDTDETIALTQRMIQIPSIDPPGNEADMSEFVKKYLEDAGIVVEAIPVEGLDENRKNIIAKIQGTGEAAPLIFLDIWMVVPVTEKEREMWICDPFWEIYMMMDSYMAVVLPI